MLQFGNNGKLKNETIEHFGSLEKLEIEKQNKLEFWKTWKIEKWKTAFFGILGKMEN